LRSDKELCIYDTLLISNLRHEDGFRYKWQSGLETTTFTAKAPGLYWVDVTTQWGTVRDSILITEKRDGCDRNIFFSSAFTPNGDGKNDAFKPLVTSRLSFYELKIFNRWGQLLFSTNNSNLGWAGNRQSSTVFVWTCRYSFSGEAVQLQKGTVLMIK
jgi:gliding motility-associated-like protein